MLVVLGSIGSLLGNALGVFGKYLVGSQQYGLYPILDNKNALLYL